MNYRDVENYWNKVATGNSLLSGADVGMLDSNPYSSIYRKREEQKNFSQLINLQKHFSVLEVGTGGGRWAFYIAPSVRNVVGIDISQEMIDIASNLKIKSGLENVNFVKSNFLEFDSEYQFNVIYFSGVLQYISDLDLEKTIQKAKDLLAPGGVIVSRDTVQINGRSVHTGNYPVIYRSVDEYLEVFKKLGFSCTRHQLAYQPKRFMGVFGRIYNLGFRNYRTLRILQDVCIRLHKLIGSPEIYVNKKYQKQMKKFGVREHRIFKYEIDRQL